MCTNDASCIIYEFYPGGGDLYCSTYIYATGVTSISSTILNSILTGNVGYGYLTAVKK